MLERVMGLSAHFAAWLGFALPARALHSLPGAGKGVTGAFSYPPFESPQFQFQQKYPPIREDISVGAGNGTPGGTGAVPPPARGTRKRYTVSFPPLAGTFPSSPIPRSSFQQKYPPIREDISVGAGNGTPGGTGAVPPPARGTRKRYTVSFPPLAGTFPSSPIPRSSFQQKYPPIREDISVGAGNGTRTHYLSLEG